MNRNYSQAGASFMVSGEARRKWMVVPITDLQIRSLMTIIIKLSSSPTSRVCPLHEVPFFSQKRPQQLHGNLEAEGNQTEFYEKFTLQLCSHPLPGSLAIFRTL